MGSNPTLSASPLPIAKCRFSIGQATAIEFFRTRILNTDEFATGRSENGAKSKIHISYDSAGAGNRKLDCLLRRKRVGSDAASSEQSGYLRQSYGCLQDKRDFPA